MKCPLKFSLPEDQQNCDPACAWFIKAKSCCAVFALAMVVNPSTPNPLNRT
jgi:hypothetical protein